MGYRYANLAKNPEKQLDAVNATIQIVAKGDNGGDWYIHIDERHTLGWK